MIEKEIINQFSQEANKGWTQFCVRKYTNNEFSNYEKEFNSEVKDGLYGDDEAIKNSCKYKNFWITTIPSLQHGRILSIARLVDPPFFKEDTNKKNLSIYYIIELLEDDNLKSEIKDLLNTQREFIKSIKKVRNIFLAHNNIGENDKTINTGIEIFFENLNNIIIKIKERNGNLKDCNDINLKYTEKLSEAGVKEIFEKITK